MMDAARLAAESRALSLTEIAEVVGGRAVGDVGTRFSGVAPVEDAGPDQLAFLALSRYGRFVADSHAGAYLVAADLESTLPEEAGRVVVDEPYAALGQLLDHFHPGRVVGPDVHPTAVLGRGVRLGSGVRIGAYVVIEEAASVGDHTRIDAHCVIGADVEIGPGCHFHPHVVVYAECVVGAGVVLHSGARVGADGFGYTFVDGRQRKVPQVGRVLLGDHVEVGANSAVDRGSIGDTVVGEGVKTDNLVHIAHNARVGAHTLLAAFAGVAGSTRVGERVWLGGGAHVSSHLTVGDGARLTFSSTVLRDVPAGETVSGYPARPHREELRRQARLGRLERLAERVERLEAGMKALEGRG